MSIVAFRIHYKRLCSVEIRHGFHLNGTTSNGRIEFEQLTAQQQQRKLARFDLFRDLRAIIPDETRKTLAGIGCLLKT